MIKEFPDIAILNKFYQYIKITEYAESDNIRIAIMLYLIRNGFFIIQPS